MKINAAVMNGKGQSFDVEELELDSPQAGEVLVRVVASGICRTDLSVRDQNLPAPLPMVLGHEGAGIVEEVGEGVNKVRSGDHVVMAVAHCGSCANCDQGQPGMCLDRVRQRFGGTRPGGSATLHRDGEVVNGNFIGQSSFATYALASERNIVRVSDDAPLELLGPLGCGVLTGAGSVLNALKPEPRSSIAVFGAGAVGMSAIMAARVAECSEIIAVDPTRGRRELALELGATHVIDPTEADPVEEVKGITGNGANYTLEATGLPQVMRQAVESLASPGVCGAVGLAPQDAEVNLNMNSVVMGRHVHGIVYGDSVPEVFIPQLIELYLQGRLPFDRLVRFYDFAQINDAVAASEDGSVIKPVLRMS